LTTVPPDLALGQLGCEGDGGESVGGSHWAVAHQPTDDLFPVVVKRDRLSEGATEYCGDVSATA
jgi:hypothetical protein